MADGVLWLVLIAGAYLIGAIPFGLLLGKVNGVDIREHGSGNIGATNLLRVCGRRIGYAGFALDVAKGAAPVVVAGLVMGLIGLDAARELAAAGGAPLELSLWIIAGAAAMLGHIFPIYLRFKGGKGVATGLGLFLAFWPWTTIPAAIALAVWIVTVKATRYVSVASIAAAVALPTAMLVLLLLGWPIGESRVGAASAPLASLVVGWPFLVLALALATLVIVKHRPNIVRLRAGTESKIGTKPAAKQTAATDEPHRDR
jgi:glycerol-3-phosphate acyltransferase PlsY